MSNCNCEGKTINLSLGCCQPVLAPIENYYTKYQIDKMMSGVTSGCCITPEEVDEKIESAKTEIESEIPSLSGYATEQWVEDKHYISGVDLSDYALKSEIPTVPTSNSAFTNDMGYLTEHQHLKTINNESLIGDGNIEIGTGGTVITIDEHLDSGSTNAVANSAITIAIDEKLDSSAYTPTDLSNYYTKDEANSAITSAVTDMATQTWVNNQGFLTEHQSLSAYSTTEEVNTLINQSVSGKVNSADIVEITSFATQGTDTIVLTREKGGSTITPLVGIKAGSGLTLNTDASANKVLSVDTTVVQEKLVAGNNITISGNTISTNCCPTIWCGDYTEWSSVSGNPDSNTIYLVHE